MSIHPSKRLLTISAAVALFAAVAPAGQATAEENTVPLSPVVLVNEVTGAGATTDTKATWDVGATDLGVIWDDGEGGVLVAYGDTFAQPGGDGAGVGGLSWNQIDGTLRVGRNGSFPILTGEGWGTVLVGPDSVELRCHRGRLTVRAVVRGDDGARFTVDTDLTPADDPLTVDRDA